MGNWADPNGILNKLILVVFLFSQYDLPHLNIQIRLVHTLQMTMNSIKPIPTQVLPWTSKIKLDMVGNKFYIIVSAIM